MRVDPNVSSRVLSTGRGERPCVHASNSVVVFVTLLERCPLAMSLEVTFAVTFAVVAATRRQPSAM